MATTQWDHDFAEVAGLRIEQAFALCSFAAELVGKAREKTLRDSPSSEFSLQI